MIKKVFQRTRPSSHNFRDGISVYFELLLKEAIFNVLLDIAMEANIFINLNSSYSSIW
jgi:hypothetical protein